MTHELREIFWGASGKGFLTLKRDIYEYMVVFFSMWLCLCVMHKKAAAIFSHGESEPKDEDHTPRLAE